MNSGEFDFSDARMLRAMAEEHLREKAQNTDAPATETDVKRLLHELQVHQIELEMQNEELRRANETAEEALKKYTMLFDFAPMGYFTIDFDGTICDLNFTGAEILGDNRYSLINSNFKLFIADASKPGFTAFLDEVFADTGKKTCKLVLGYNTTNLRTVFTEGVAMGDDKKCLLSVVDISGFK